MRLKRLIPSREERGVLWFVFGLLVVVPVVIAVGFGAALLFPALVFMVGTWLIHHVIEAVPALGFWQSFALAAGLWVLGLMIKMAFWLLLGGIARG